MSEQKKKEIAGIAESIAEIGTENLEGAKNYLAGFVAGIKAARDEKKTEETGRKEGDKDDESGEG